MTMKVDLVVDLQFGSTGKGLLCGYLAEKIQYDVVVNCNMPNAGHTYIDSKGMKMIFKVLPSGLVSPNLKHLMIGPGAVISETQLALEIRAARAAGYEIENKIRIHPNCTILRHEHTMMEQELFKSIASTAQGSACAVIDKMSRTAGNMPVAGKMIGFMYEQSVVTHDQWATILDDASQIMVEGAQGHSLSIDGQFYPYTTSRSCAPSSFYTGAGVPMQYHRNVYGTVRTYPIRVGNTSEGHSGPCYDDQKEIPWSDIGQEPELTTVTKRQRRLFTYSHDQIAEACKVCRPDAIFLNFANYCDQVTLQRITADILAIGRNQNLSGQIIRWLGRGPTFHDVERIGNALM